MQQGLGLWLGVTDPRNHVYTATPPHRSSVMHADYAPILDQGDVGACTGFTGADVANTAMFFSARKLVTHSTHYLTSQYGFDFYHLNTQTDEWPQAWPPDDSGSSVLAMAKVLKRMGFIRSYSWARGFSAMLSALERGPVMLGILWTEGMSDPDRSGLIRPTGDLVGGHALMARGVSYARQRVRLRNHWRKDWGINGECEVSFADMDWLMDEPQQGECVVPVPI